MSETPKDSKRRGAKARDDFKKKTRDALARRVGFRCSNPGCLQATSGPQKTSTKAIEIGVAAHITAAAVGGPRYDASLSTEQRTAIENGIWLCQNCAKLVDNDPPRYPAGVLEQWKTLAEERALLELDGGANHASGDVEILQFFTQCFDRPAFQVEFRCEGSMEAFERAMEDTIIAINTGCQRDRNGKVLSRRNGKAFLTKMSWRREMDTIVDLLRAIKARYARAIATNEIHVHALNDGDEFFVVRSPDVARWMDETRAQILERSSQVCREAGLLELDFPRRAHGHW
jgi:hypothetical protein